MAMEVAALKVRMNFAGGSIIVEFSDTATARAFADCGESRAFGETLTSAVRHFLDGETAETR